MPDSQSNSKGKRKKFQSAVRRMATIWSETFDPRKHHDAMWPTAGVPRNHKWRAASLQAHNVYFVRVCSFTFEFHNIPQLEECLRFFSQKIRPSGRRDVSHFGPDPSLVHSLSQQWHERFELVGRVPSHGVSRFLVLEPSRTEKIREDSLCVLECGGKSARHRFRNAVAGQLRN